MVALGRDEALLRIGGRRLRLGRRHSEMLVLLPRRTPRGAPANSSALDLYGDDRLHPVTLRAELSRLRRVARAGTAGLAPVPAARAGRRRLPRRRRRCWTRATRREALRRVPRAAAARLSDAPGVARLRRLVDGQLRAAVLAARGSGAARGAGRATPVGRRRPGGLARPAGRAAARTAGLAPRAGAPRPSDAHARRLRPPEYRPARRNVLQRRPQLASPRTRDHPDDGRQEAAHDPLRHARVRRRDRQLPVALRPLDRRRVRAARAGPVLREPHPGQRAALHRDRPRHRRGRRAGPRRRARRRPTPGAAPRSAERANILNKIADRMEENLEAARRRRDLGERQAGTRDAGRRHPAGHRPLPLLRRRDPGPGGLARRARRRHRRVPLPRAARRGRPDHPVELPDPDGDLEARARAGRGQRGGAQARRADPGVDPLLDEPGRRPAAAGRGQHRQRLRRRGGQAAGVRARGWPRSPSPARPPPAG